MIKETMENGIYKAFDTDTNEVLLTIKSLGNDVYRALNDTVDITAEIIPLDDYRTSVKCLDYKRASKRGTFKKSTEFITHYKNWLVKTLEDKGFIRKSKPIK